MSEFEEPKYYVLKFRLDNANRYLIWCPNRVDAKDRVVVQADKALCFSSIAILRDYCAKHDLQPLSDEEPILHDLDYIANWLNLKKSKRARRVDCNKMLTAWSLFDDFERSVGREFDFSGERTSKIYEKLFEGNNFPSITPEGYMYIPLWSSVELQIIHENLASGLKNFRLSLKKPEDVNP